MSSRLVPTTGMRENPERSASDSSWRRVVSRVTNTTSVRGTMTSFTSVSPSSNTEWIIFDSPASMSSCFSAMSTRSRSSASVANGPSA